MGKMRWAVVGLIGLFIGCQGIITPPQGIGTEYPCGIHGQVCQANKDHTAFTCCGEYDLCGNNLAFSRCPYGYCCWDGVRWP